MQKAFVTKFNDRLTSDVAESSQRSDPIEGSNDLVDKLVEVNYSGRVVFFFLIVVFL